MSRLVFLDSNIFIWAYNRPDSNSAKILDLMDEGRVSAIVSEKVLQEVKKYFLKCYNEDVWYSIFKYVITSAEIIKRDEIMDEIPKWIGKIKEKDLEHLATVKHLGLKYLVSFDEHYRGFEEYMTPKEFIKHFGMKPSETDY